MSIDIRRYKKPQQLDRKLDIESTQLAGSSCSQLWVNMCMAHHGHFPYEFKFHSISSVYELIPTRIITE